MLLKPLTKIKPRIMSARAAHPRSYHLAQTFSQLSSFNKQDKQESSNDKPIFLSNLKPSIKKSQNTSGRPNNFALHSKEKKPLFNKRNRSISKLKLHILTYNNTEQIENKVNQEVECCGSPALWLKKPNKKRIHMALPESKENNAFVLEQHNSNASTSIFCKTNYPHKFSTAKYNNFGYTWQNNKERSVIGEEIVTTNSNEFSNKNNPNVKNPNNESSSNGNNNSSKTSFKNHPFRTLSHKIELDPYLHKAIEGCHMSWTPGEIVYEGSESVIYKALNQKTGQIFIAKRFIDQKSKNNFDNEVFISNQVTHKNIIKYIGTDQIINVPFIYLEYISGGNLKHLVDLYGPLNECLIRHYLIQILEGLAYLHSKKIIHRDIKCSNILVNDDGIIKICDFGVSSQNLNSEISDDCFLSNLKGTLPWCAPEVICQKSYGLKADIWSLGCSVIEMGGMLPWGKIFENSFQCMNLIGKTDKIPDIPQFFSLQLKDFILQCLIRNQDQRADCALLLKHPFIVSEI